MLRKRCSSPWAVMVEPLNAVVTDWTMWGPRRSENLACETVFELDRLVSNGNLSRPRRRSVSCPIRSIVLAVKKIVATFNSHFSGSGYLGPESQTTYATVIPVFNLTLQVSRLGPCSPRNDPWIREWSLAEVGEHTKKEGRANYWDYPTSRFNLKKSFSSKTSIEN